MSFAPAHPSPPTTALLGWLRWALPGLGLALWLAGQPAPHPDDLFFGGTAISVARGEGLANPWISNWLLDHFQTDRFLVQTPYHTAFLGCWLHLVGISGAMLRAFAVLWTVVGSYALADALIRGGLSRGWTAASCVVYAIFISSYGLRADALGLGLVGLGHLVLVRRGILGQVIGLALCGLGVATHPFAFAVAFPIVAAHTLLGFMRENPEYRTRFVLAAALGAIAGTVLPLLLGAWLLRENRADFLRVFHTHRSLALPGAEQRWDFFSAQFVLGQEVWRRLVFALLALVLLGAATWNYPTAVRFRWLLAGLGVFSLLGYLLYAQYLARYLVFALLIGSSLVLAAPRMWAPKAILGPAVAILLLLGTATDVLALAARTLPPPSAQLSLLREVVAASPHTHVVLDEFAVRHLYDFRPPPRCRDWQVSRPAGGRPLGFAVQDKPADELWVVSAYKLAHAVAGFPANPIYLRFGNRVLRSLELGVDLTVVP